MRDYYVQIKLFAICQVLALLTERTYWSLKQNRSDPGWSRELQD